jgi:alpha-N-arabinofuranosidase
MEYHVSKSGNDGFDGSKEKPFLTISRAARTAEEGDRIIVHEGVYRECVNPRNGARTTYERIIYQAAENETAVIKGSEQIKGWEKWKDSIWKASISNKLFGDYNPYSETIDGDWLMDPIDKPLHTGQVYIDGRALREVSGTDRMTEGTWFARVKEELTEIYADFGSDDPNESLVEINVRRSCFCPGQTGIDYITVRGFEFAHAATPWAPPTAE